ncbi:MAG TPA: carbon monoxide dehydrogenase subunit G [Mycobacteriales bacterium]|nr:carbon monoxide dehydrogenase subunit G [Mycobacteriales bacterium]
MKVSGEATLRGPVERVYAALHDPAVLVRTIPGCERLERVGPDAYLMTVTAGVASIRETFSGDVRLTDQQAPHSFVLRAAGSGAPGTVTAEVTVTLAGRDGVTVLAYDADAVVGGMVGGVGQRVLSGVARKTAGEFFAAVDAVLTAPEPPVPAAEAPEPAPPAVPTSEPAGAPTAAYTRPAATGSAEVFGGPDFVRGAVFGAVVALVGALVGGLLAGRRR